MSTSCKTDFGSHWARVTATLLTFTTHYRLFLVAVHLCCLWPLACTGKGKVSNGQHYIAVHKIQKSNLEDELKTSGQALRKDDPSDIAIEVLFETDDPNFTEKSMEDQSKEERCGELRGGLRPYVMLSSGFREKLRSCIFVGPPAAGQLTFQAKGYPPISLALSR